MVAGLIQLAASGSLDNYININPDISFYLFAYKRHTKFALETKILDFDKTIEIDSYKNIFRCYIKPNGGDLLSNIYLVYKIPPIYSNDIYRFKWIKNFGTLLIKSAKFIIGSSEIDNISGELLLILNELKLNVKDSYNNITGNIDALTDPKQDLKVIKINNNFFETITYPIGNMNTENPSIPSREIIIPLEFNFTKHPSLSLLLTRLQNRNDIYIELVIEDIENLYQIYSKDLDLYISPRYYNELYSLTVDKQININTFVKKEDKNLNAYIEATHVYLDNYERGLFMTASIKSILIERIFISNFYDITPGNNLASIIELTGGANNHNKEILWTLRRSDYYNFNDNMNFTNRIPEDETKPIIASANIYFNNAKIMEDKNEAFFNLIQPYQHHSCIPKKGIYCFSFGLHPEKWQPTGSFNGAQVRTYLYVYVNNANNTIINNKLINMNKDPYYYNYKLRYYVRNYNVLEYIGGAVGLKYTT
jgi:hypothetical protein